MAIRVLLAAAHTMFREGLRGLLPLRCNLQVVADTGDGAEVLRLVESYDVDIAVVETLLHGVSGLEAIERVRQDRPRTRCIAVSEASSGLEVERALAAGATGFVSKANPVSELVEAMEAVAAGRCFVSHAVTQHLVDALRPPSEGRSLRLTRREREVLHLIAEGGSCNEIAQRLGVSPRTVESHRGRLMNKLEIHKTASLVRFAIREGLINPYD